MNLKNLNSIYFIGIGGVGMSALALYMQAIGKNVAGYDKTASLITASLTAKEIEVSFEDDVSDITPEFKYSSTLIVYTPAVKREENNILNYYLSNGFTVLKRAELLGIITRDTISLAVAGTHGKTTTSSILGHILMYNNIDATSFLGGIAENYNSNLILNGNKYTVVEADEYDRSFLQLAPNYACITSTDADHLDIYEEAVELENTFAEFGALASEKLFVRKGIAIKGITYGVEQEADYDAENVSIVDGSYVFDIKTPKQRFENVKTNLPGRYNIANTMAAVAMADAIGISLLNISKALGSFKGVHRRFSYRVKTDEFILIDDYAHHPTEIEAVYKAVREMYGEQELLCVFQPHTYTRTRDFESGFVNTLAKFDKIILLPIYAAREHPIKGVSSAELVQKIKVINTNVELTTKEDLINRINKNKKRIVLMLGAGDIGVEVGKVVKSITT